MYSIESGQNPENDLFFTQIHQLMLGLEQSEAEIVTLLLITCSALTTLNHENDAPITKQILASVRERLSASLPESSVAQLDTNEFAVLLQTSADLRAILPTVEQIIYAFQRPIRIEQRELFVPINIGIATSETSHHPEEIVRNARQALGTAQSLGRGHYSIFHPELAIQATTPFLLADELHNAIKQDELRVYYQPVLSLKTGVLIGFEALIRWQHPQHGLLLPSDFLPLATTIGMDAGLDRWVIDTACRQVQQWQADFPKLRPLNMHINISGRHIGDTNLTQYVQRLLFETGLQSHNLCFELLENTMSNITQRGLLALNQLRSTGIQLSLDNFGTGYSSLSYLHRLPINTLKVDRLFVSSLDLDSRTREIVRTIISLAHSLNMNVIAEGVETSSHLEQLQLLGCDYGQGFFFSKALDVQAATELVQLHALRGGSRSSGQHTEPPTQPWQPTPSDGPSPYTSPPVVPLPSATYETSILPASSIENASAPVTPDSFSRDLLTGMLSRDGLDTYLAWAIDQSKRTAQPLTLLMIDLDHFKSINDAFGHLRGDQVLVEFAQRVQDTVRSTDRVFRYGGDEFIIVLSNFDTDQASNFAKRLLDNICLKPFAGDPPLNLTLSIGIAVYPKDGLTAEALFEVADQRSYKAKRSGRGRAVADDLLLPSILTPEKPSRLIERDRQLEELRRFFDSLPAHNRGLLRVHGPIGSGTTRFLNEVASTAHLHGYAVLQLSGTLALCTRVYGVLSETLASWGLSLRLNAGATKLGAALQREIIHQGRIGLVIILDNVTEIDHATQDIIRSLFAESDVQRLALIVATPRSAHDYVQPTESIIHAEIALEPLSPMGIRAWLRQTLSWEAPEEVLTWLQRETGGRPATIERGLSYLIDQGILVPILHGWSYGPDLLNTRLDELAYRGTTRWNNLPSDLPAFVGRENDIRQLKQLVRDHRIVSIIGPGGLGKSHLAIQIAAEVSHAFADGVVYIALNTVGSSAFLLYTLAEALQLSLTGTQPPIEQIRALLEPRSLLIVLDGFEHLREGTPLLNDLIASAPGVHLLVTSRDRLIISGGISYELNGFDMPSEAELADAEQFDAVQMFLRSAQQSYPGFTHTRDDLYHIARICRLLEGMPLGIELAAAWTRTFSCAAIAHKIELNLSFLANGTPEGTSRGQSLLAMIDSFWFLMSLSEQRILRQMAVFQGGFDVDAARKIIDASPFFLDGLASKGYLRWAPNHRYELHQLLRQYAVKRLQDVPQEQADAHERHGRYYLNLLRQRDVMLFGSRQILEEINSDLENIRAAWNWAVNQGQIIELARSIDGLVNYYQLRGFSHEAESVFADSARQLQPVVTPTGAAPFEAQHLYGRLQVEQARFLAKLARYDQALQVLVRVMSLARQIEASDLEAMVAYQRGEALWQQGAFGEAWPYLFRAAHLALDLKLHALAADSLRRLGRVACEQGNYDAARSSIEQSLHICRQIGDRQREGRALNDLGIVTDAHGNYAASQQYYEQCLLLAREIGDRPSESTALVNLGAVCAEQGHYDAAGRYFAQALPICREIGERRNEAIVLENLGDAARVQGDLTNAKSYYEQTLRLCRQIGDRQGESVNLANLGLLSHQLGDQRAAHTYCFQALEIAQEIGDRRTQANAITYLGHAFEAQGRPTDAITRYEQAIQHYRELGQLNLAVEALAGLARLALAEQKLTPAESYVETILNVMQFGKLDGTAEPFRVALTCYEVLQARGNPQAAEVLRTAHAQLLERADRITDSQIRDVFLHAVPSHRTILQVVAQESVDQSKE